MPLHLQVPNRSVGAQHAVPACPEQCVLIGNGPTRWPALTRTTGFVTNWRNLREKRAGRPSQRAGGDFPHPECHRSNLCFSPRIS